MIYRIRSPSCAIDIGDGYMAKKITRKVCFHE